MIDIVQGTIAEKTPAHVVVETGGIGLKILIPVSSYSALGEVGDRVRLLTHLHVREDALQLYGFATAEERILFRLLIGVSGIGPKLAQTILSGMPVEHFKTALARQDIAELTSISGVGKKTAERLILELKDKIPFESRGSEQEAVQISSTGAQAIMALVSLGYLRPKAQAVVRQIVQTDPGLSVEDVVRRALQKMV